jgi:hypothetical protein
MPARRSLPDYPNLRYLKVEAKERTRRRAWLALAAGSALAAALTPDLGSVLSLGRESLHRNASLLAVLVVV